ncbi:hypothetical protein INR49_000567 [Caranx melampygus]|nr:hypothetical protein INR49_000567 [Caranx melampygus]
MSQRAGAWGTRSQETAAAETNLMKRHHSDKGQSDQTSPGLQKPTPLSACAVTASDEPAAPGYHSKLLFICILFNSQQCWTNLHQDIRASGSCSNLRQLGLMAPGCQYLLLPLSSHQSSLQVFGPQRLIVAGAPCTLNAKPLLCTSAGAIRTGMLALSSKTGTGPFSCQPAWLRNKDQCDAEGDFDLEASRVNHHPDTDYDDDQMLIRHNSDSSGHQGDGFLPSPQLPTDRHLVLSVGRRSSQDDPPPSSCTALPLHLVQQQIMAVAGLDASRIHRLSPTRWTGTVLAVWAAFRSSEEELVVHRRSGRPSQPQPLSVTSAVPSESCTHFLQKRGSANSLVEAVLISEGLGKYARDPTCFSNET